MIEIEESGKELEKKIKEIHKIIVRGLINPKLTHTSEECDYELRSYLFSQANICVMDLVWHLERQFEFDFENLKKFVYELEEKGNERISN